MKKKEEKRANRYLEIDKLAEEEKMILERKFTSSEIELIKIQAHCILQSRKLIDEIHERMDELEKSITKTILGTEIKGKRIIYIPYNDTNAVVIPSNVRDFIQYRLDLESFKIERL